MGHVQAGGTSTRAVPVVQGPRSVEACNPTLCASKDRLEAWALRQEDTSALDSQLKPQSLRLSTKQ